MKRILRRPTVQDRTGLRRSAIYERIKAGTFPKPIVLGPRAVGWLESEVDAWIDGLTSVRDASHAKARASNWEGAR